MIFEAIVFSREFCLSLFITVLCIAGLCTLGILSLRKKTITQISTVRFFIAILLFSTSLYILPGLWGAPLTFCSKILPQKSTQDFDMVRIVYENSAQGKINKKAEEYFENRKYQVELFAPKGVNAFYDLEEAKYYAKLVEKPILMVFDGKTGRSCRGNDILMRTELTSYIKEHFVVLILYVDVNYIEIPKEEWTMSYYGKLITTLGKKNLNYQIMKFQMNAQPYYVIVDSDEKVLTKENMVYCEDINPIKDFLNEGLENYKKKHAQEAPIMVK